MEGYQVEATRDNVMDYRAAQYWNPQKARRHLPKKKKDLPANDKYGSVSAHSTSAIYGALRAPHYHAIYDPMWYASVRSLNRACPRIYPAEWTKEASSPIGVIPLRACVCLFRPTHDSSSHLKQPPRPIARCKYCVNGYSANGSTNICPPKRLNTEKLKASPVAEESKPPSRMFGYKKCLSKYSKHFKTKDSSQLGRKSILECDVTAYDLIKKVTISEDSDMEDNLSDNAIAKIASHSALKSDQISKEISIYSEKRFSDHPIQNCSESVCIPDPDYSDDSDNETIIGTKYPKFTYSPPPIRKSSEWFCSRELSKSLSSLQSDDQPPFLNEHKLDSSSDCSSSLSSDYPTWTSSSSNELKSILKKKRRIAVQQDRRVFQHLREKKQVQFLPGENSNRLQENSVIHCDIYQTISQVLSDNTLEEVKEAKSLQGLSLEDDGRDLEEHRRKRNLPKRRFSDLHILLCPTKSSICGYNKKSHSRSLPDSLSQLEQTFCFNFDKNDKILPSSTFYVPVEGADLSENVSSIDVTALTDVPPSIDNILLKGEEVISPEEEENEYENLDPIYEELNNLSSSALRLMLPDCNQKSFFEGASKIDILSYLEDAKERGISEGLSEDEKVIIEEEEEDKVLSEEEEKPRVISTPKEVILEKIEEVVDEESKTRISEVERNDSGVGTETSKPSRLKPIDWEEQLCADCDHQVEPLEDDTSGLLFSPLVCRKCEFRRCERKEIIIEFVDTELKYGRDLKIIKDEFYRPMEIAGLLAKDQLISIFLNIEELLNANCKFSEKLQDALDIAMEHGDEDYTTVNMGKIFIECSSMLHAFETYCVKQAPASVLLSSLEKEKELLRIFLRVSQMENTLLRRMNLPAFLMVPVQRVTRYPLLLSRLHKVTPIHHKDRAALKEAQQKVELHLEHINQQTKGVGGTKIWRKISNISASHRRLGKDIGSIKLRKMALEVLNWKQDETRFVMAAKLLFTPITDYPWNKKGKFSCVHALLIALGKPNSNYRPEQPEIFPRNTGIRDASLLLMKEKNGRFVVVRDPLYLGNCIISCETDDMFEIQEYTTKDAYLMKGETKKDTKDWLCMLRYHAKDLGSWRKRRNALANIMINGMIRH